MPELVEEQEPIPAGATIAPIQSADEGEELPEGATLAPIGGAAPKPADTGVSMQAHTPSRWQQFKEDVDKSVYNSAPGRAIESAMPRVADALGIHSSESESNPDAAQHAQQLIAPEYLQPEVSGLDKAAGIDTPKNQNRVKGALKGLGGMTSAEAMATLAGTAAGAAATAGLVNPASAAVLGRLVSGGFTFDMLHSLYQQNREYRHAVDSGDAAKAQEIQGEMGLTGVMALMTGAHSLHGVAGRPTASSEDLHKEAIHDAEKVAPPEHEVKAGAEGEQPEGDEIPEGAQVVPLGESRGITAAANKEVMTKRQAPKASSPADVGNQLRSLLGEDKVTVVGSQARGDAGPDSDYDVVLSSLDNGKTGTYWPDGTDRVGMAQTYEKLTALEESGQVSDIKWDDTKRGIKFTHEGKEIHVVPLQSTKLPEGTFDSSPKKKPAPAPQVSATTDKSDALAPLAAEATNEPQMVGEKHEETGRDILQPIDNPEILDRAARQAAPNLENGLQEAVKDIPGARLDAVREQKNPERLTEKIQDEGQPAQTIPDYLASRVVVDSPEARSAAVNAIKDKFPLVREDDKFENGDDDYGYRRHALQVQMPNGLSAEVHVVPKEVADINADEHENYKSAREADLKGDKEAHKKAAAEAKAKNDAAMTKFNERNQSQTKGDRGESPEQAQGEKSPAAPTFQKGMKVKLKDGSTGRVDYYNEALGRGRVTTEAGKKLPSVSRSDMEPVHETRTEKWTGFDLDQTLAHYDGYKGDTHIGKPIEGPAIEEARKLIAEGKNVKIFTARVADDPNGVARKAIEDWTEKNLGKRLEVTNVKDQYMETLYDDRARQVGKNTGEVIGHEQPTAPEADQQRGAKEEAESGKPGAQSAGKPKEEVKEPANESGTEVRREKEADAKASDNGSREENRPDIRPSEVARVPVAALDVDPKRFQYKLNTDTEGATNKLKDVKWNDALSGIVTAWRDPADGKLYVVNGHHRFELARRFGVKDLAVRVLPEEVKTAPEARIVGAMQNIAEGNGTATDAAKFMRDTGYTEKELEKYGISLSGSLAERGTALAGLADPIFDMVVSGRLAENRGVAIGRAADSPESQEALLKLIERAEERGKSVTNATIEELGRMVKGSGVVATKTENLFGTEDRTQSLALEKAELSSHVRKQIATEKKLFGSLTSDTKAGKLAEGKNKIDTKTNKSISEKAEQAQEFYDRLSTRKGSVDDLLESGAKRIAEGENATKVKDDTYKRIRTAIREALTAGPEEARSDRAEDTAGSEDKKPSKEELEAAGQKPMFKRGKEEDQTKTPAFKKWFGDSKVVDADGKPLRVYHGTDGDFAVFGYGQDQAQYFSTDPETASAYSTGNSRGENPKPNVMPAYLKVENPWVITEEQLSVLLDFEGDRDWTQMEGVIEQAKDDGYDGIHLNGVNDYAGDGQEQWITFEPTQIKSAIGNRGTFDPDNPNILFKRENEASRTWYLKSENLIDQKMKGPMSGDQLMKMLENGGVKADELKWTGLGDFLKGKFRVTPTEVKQHLAEGGIQVKDVVKGAAHSPGTLQRIKDIGEELDEMGEPTEDTQERWEALGNELDELKKPERQAGLTKYKDYQLPGGENYREMLLTLPETPETFAGNKRLTEISKKVQELGNQWREASTEARTAAQEKRYSDIADAVERTTAIEKEQKALGDEHRKLLDDRDRSSFSSGHWEERNILAHVRFNDRVTPDGKRLLHLEEIQSDWHQKGRSKGYGDPEGVARLQEQVDANQKAFDAIDKKYRDLDNDLLLEELNDGKDIEKLKDEVRFTKGARASILETLKRSKNELDGLKRSGVPDAPFKKDWHEMAFRRMVRHATENGYDGVSWTPGEKQAERYDLSKQIESVSYNPPNQRLEAIDHTGRTVLNEKVPPEKIGDYVGKDIARKLLESEPAKKGYHMLEGLDLKVGGEGMKGFYDKIIPDYARKFGKQWGAKVGEEKVNYQNQYGGNDHLPVPYLPITDEMRKSVTSEGVALFKDKTAQEAMRGASRVATAAKADVIPADEEYGHAPMVVLNSFARELLNHVDLTLREGGKWSGVTLPKGYADTVVEGLRGAAKDLRDSGQARQADAIDAIADSVDGSRDSEGHVVMVHEPDMEHTVGEEQFHSYQTRKGAMADVAFQMSQNPEVRKAQRHLAKQGYPNSPVLAVLEATAKVANGDWKGAGLTVEEAATVLHDFFDAMAKARGPEVLDDVPQLAEEMQSTLDEARARYGREAKVPDSKIDKPATEKGSGAQRPRTWKEVVAARRGIQEGQDIGRAPVESGSYTQQSLFKRKAVAEPEEEKTERGLPIHDLIDQAGELSTVKTPIKTRIERSIKNSVGHLTKDSKTVYQALAEGKGTLAGMWDAYRRPPEWTDYKDIKGKFLGEMQAQKLRLTEFAKELNRTVPDKQRRIAMTNWIEANGDKQTLLDRARKSKKADVREGYELATKLTPEELKIAKTGKEYFDKMFNAGKDAGLLEHGVADYIMHIHEPESAEANKVKALLNFSLLQPNPAFIKERVFPSYFEAEQAGEVPKDKDFGFLVSAYQEAFARAIESRGFIRSLLENGRASDGRPLASLGRMGKWAQLSPTDEPYVLTQPSRPDKLAHDIQDYRFFDHPALRNWLWELSQSDADMIDPKLFEDEKKALAIRGDLLLHPEIFKDVSNVLSKSAIRGNKVGKAILDVSNTMKQSLLSFSGFHQTQETVHALEHGVNPTKLVELSADDKKQMALINHGLMVAEFDGQQSLSEGVSSTALKYVPIIGDAMAKYQHYLFGEYIPRVKMTMALHALERNQIRFKGKLNQDQILEMTANQSNAAFGGLNYEMMGRNKTFQDLFRLLALAPDFLEARARFVGQAFTPHGKEQRLALVRGALVMYGGARILNAILNDGDAKWDKDDAFKVVIKGRRYGLRTVQGDLLGLVNDPRMFVSHRLNPMTVRPFMEYMSGRDEFGRQKSSTSQAKDYVKGAIPIPIQSHIKQAETNWVESILAAAGMEVGKYYTPAENLAHKKHLQAIPDKPEDPDAEKVQESHLKYEMTRKMRDGKATTTDLWNLVNDGKLTAAEARKVQDDAEMTQLQVDTKSLSLSDALDVYAKAGQAERADIEPIIQEKRSNFNQDARHTERDREKVEAKLEKLHLD